MQAVRLAYSFVSALENAQIEQFLIQKKLEAIFRALGSLIFSTCSFQQRYELKYGFSVKMCITALIPSHGIYLQRDPEPLLQSLIRRKMSGILSLKLTLCHSASL